MRVDIKTFENYIRKKIYELNVSLSKKRGYLQKLDGDKEKLDYIFNNYDGLDTQFIVTEVSHIASMLKQEKKRINKTYISELISFIDNKFKEENTNIEKLLFRISEKQEILNSFDLRTHKLKSNISSEEKLRSITSTLHYSDIPLKDKNLILQELIRQDLEALKQRDDERIKKENIEYKKNIAIQRIRENKKPKAPEKPVTIEERVNWLNEKQKKILSRANEIIRSRIDSIMEGFSDEVNEGYELSIDRDEETGKTELYIGALSTNKENLMLCLKLIHEGLKEFKKSQDTELINRISEYIEYYNRYDKEQKIIDKNLEDIRKLEENNSELLENIEVLYKSFFDKVDKLSMEERNKMDSIRNLLEAKKQENLLNGTDTDEFDEVKEINSIGYGTKINFAFYNEMILLHNIKETYNEYKNVQKLENKEEILNQLQDLFEQYQLLVTSRSMVDEANNGTKQENKEDNNILLFLTAPKEDITCIEDFNNQNKTEVAKEESKIERGVNLLANSERNYIFATSEKVKKNGPVSKSLHEKVRKIRIGDTRIAFADINAFGNMELNLDKDCYVVVTCGAKLGDKEIYTYINSEAMRNNILGFYSHIEETVKSIKKMDITDEEKDAKIKSFITTLASDGREKYDDFIKRMKNKSDNPEDDKEVTPNDKQFTSN